MAETFAPVEVLIVPANKRFSEQVKQKRRMCHGVSPSCAAGEVVHHESRVFRLHRRCARDLGAREGHLTRWSPKRKEGSTILDDAMEFHCHTHSCT